MALSIPSKSNLCRKTSVSLMVMALTSMKNPNTCNRGYVKSDTRCGSPSTTFLRFQEMHLIHVLVWKCPMEILSLLLLISDYYCLLLLVHCFNVEKLNRMYEGSEKELRERLVGFSFSAFRTSMSNQEANPKSGCWYPVGLAQMEQLIGLDQEHLRDQLKVIAPEVKHEKSFVYAQKTFFVLELRITRCQSE
ncbi:hypothetical protein JHK87_004418 [Glycine soja]|nr:hypothetical protein JHK87_004418 [Glycine soja]